MTTPAGGKGKSPAVELEIDDRVVRVTNPDRVYFPARGETKLDLVEYYLAVGDGIVNALYERPCMLHRFPDGVSGEKVHQKRMPSGAPPWMRDRPGALPALEPDGRRAVRHRARPGDLGGADVDRRVPPLEQPARRHREARRVAHRPRPGAGVRLRHRAPGGPRRRTRCWTSSARSASRRRRAASGLHVYVRIVPDHGFADVRRAALAFAREVERRAPDDVTTTWWRKDRDPAALFVDYNQNARDHTIAAAYSVRGNPEAHRLDADPVGRGRRRGAAGLHDRDRAGPVRRARRPARRHRRARRSTSRRCWSGPTGTRPPGRHPRSSPTPRRARPSRPRSSRARPKSPIRPW